MNTLAPNLVRLIYGSRIPASCTPSDLEAILDVSRKNNQAMGITGALCYSARGFLQCLEGSRTAVNEMYRRIAQDPRNEEVTLVAYGHIEERSFGQWFMAYVRADQMDNTILSKYGITADFDPYDIDAEKALGLLCDMARERAAFLARQTK